MKIVVVILLAVAVVPAAADVDPSLVGMWKLQWPGPEILWQVRADGAYRSVGVGARPLETWGRMQAANGKWSSERPGGTDGGTYAVSGNIWTVNATLGKGTWERVWPAGAKSDNFCPDTIDVAAVEALFAGTVRGRMVQRSCEYEASRIGFSDKVSIENVVNNPMTDVFRLKRADCELGTSKDRLVRCIKDVGDTAFFYQGRLNVYAGNRRIVVSLSTYPADPARNDADAIALARAALKVHH
jgi:hypothetical protein